MASYAVELQRRYDGLLIARFPDLPEALAFGRDDEEAVEEAAKSLGAALLRRQQSGEPIPPPVARASLRVEPRAAPARYFA